MSVELRPFGVACNIGCRYCYQNPQREAGNVRQSYDMARMRAAVEREGGPFTLFGGEPLLLPLEPLEELLRWGFETWGGSGMQTNGLLINDAHMQLFAKYNVEVGVSVDGPDELNDLRWDRTEERTRRSTETILRNIERLCREHRPPGLIATLHQLNASPARLPRLLAWARELDALGITSMRLHPLEIDSEEMRPFALTDEENATAFLAFAALQPELKHLRFDVVGEMERALLGRDGQTSCVWRACDPYTTDAVRGVEGNGQSSNCGRTNKDGIDFIKAERPGFERYLALYQTPQEEGGCKGCRFFLMCRGQCPGTAIDSDWRNRSELCGLWKRLFIQLEKQLILRNEVPLSIHAVRHRLEAQLVMLWKEGRNATTQELSWLEPDELPGADGAPSAAAPFTMPPFLRRAYAGEAQRAVWEPRLAALASALPRLAVAAVAEGVVPAAVTPVEPRDVFALHNFAAARGLTTQLLGTIGGPRHLAIGDAELSLPACCAASRTREPLPPLTDLPPDPALNTLLRPLGIDLLGYEPCSLTCEASRRRAERLLAFARTSGIAGMEKGIEWLDPVLAWPVEWSALHGIAEIKTAVLKADYATAYTPSKVTVRFHGSAPAADGARGLTFAFQRPAGRPAENA
jgi:uncharacterized protein